MKNFYSLVLIAVILLSGCSKASQTGSTVESTGVATAASATSAEPTSSGVFAYIPYKSGRIDSFTLEDGKLIKTGEIKAAPFLCTPVSSPTGQFVYTFDNRSILTRYKIAEDGNLTDPVAVKPESNNQNVSDMSIHPSGKFLLLSTSGRDSQSDARIGGTVVLPIRSDGTVGSYLTRQSTAFQVQKALFAPTGRFLYLNSSRGIVTYSMDATGKIAEKSVSTAALGSTAAMAINSNGSRLLVGDERELSEILLCAVNDGKLSRLSSVRVSQESNYGITTSMAVDSFGNVVTVNANNWLACYTTRGDQIAEGDTYLNFRDHKWRNKSEAHEFLQTTPAYADRLQEAKDRPDWKNAAFLGAYLDLGSFIATARLAPDGNMYVSSTSGVYRFKSTAGGVAYDRPAVTWPDTAHLFRGRNQASNQEKRDAEPTADGMIFVQRK